MKRAQSDHCVFQSLQGPVSLRLMTSQFKDIVTHTQKYMTVKCTFYGVWVQNFVWNFKDALWNFTHRGFFVPCDLEIRWMSLKNNRAPLLCYFKLCASFHSNQRNQTEVTVRKRSIWIKIRDFFVPRDLEIWWMILKKTVGHIFDATSSYVQHFVAICEFKLELWSGKAQIGTKFVLTSITLNFDLCFDLYYLKLWHLALTLCMDIAFVNDNNSWEFQDDMMRGTLWKRCNGRTADSWTDGQTDSSVLRAAWSWLKNSIWHPPTFHPGTWRFHLPRANCPRPLPLSVRQIKQYFPTSGMKLFPTCGQDR